MKEIFGVLAIACNFSDREIFQRERDMKTEHFGTDRKGRDISLITLENKNGMKALLTDFGADLVSLLVPDRDGRPIDVVLGYENLSGYENNGCCFGATIGRCGNRVANAEFTLNGRKYEMAKSPNYKHNCHSTPDVFFTRQWEFKTDVSSEGEQVVFSLFSPDKDQGFPGNMDIRVIYTLTKKNTLMIEYQGLSDQDTVMNMTNHSYFNLDVHNSGNILDHYMKVYSDFVTEVDDELIPTGKLLPVAGSAFDFREWKKIGEDILNDEPVLRYGNGYDHNFVVNDGKKVSEPTLVAECRSEKTGIYLSVYTDLPGIQVYTANGLVKDGGKDGCTYMSGCGVCFETQFAPNAINIPSFEQPVIKANQLSISKTYFSFDNQIEG